MRIFGICALAGIVSGAAFCQDKPAGPVEFEVATIKPSETMSMGGRVMVRIGVRNDGAMVSYNRMTLKQLVQNAYGVKDYQVTGAGWMDTQPFDINAKLPDGASADQAPEMLQNLLKERFKVTLHRETKDYPVYALVAAKGGTKLKKADPNNAFPTPPGAPPLPPPPPGDGPAAGGRAGGPPPGGAMRIMMGPNGGHMESRGTTLPNFANMISRWVGRPVVDETGIAGEYDFSLDISPDEMANNAQMKNAMAMAAAMGPPGGGPAGPGPGRGPEGGQPPEGGSIFQSIQAYGLKLEAKKAPIEIIVIDSADKSPAEN